jgi:hypothetical protein
MVRFQSFAVAVALLSASAGCVHKPALNSYRLLRQNAGPVLVPPGVARPDLSLRTFVADIPAGKRTCAAEGGIEVQPWKKKIRVTLNRDALLDQREPGWLAAWSMRAEAQGCIALGRGQDLANLIVESAPMDPAVAFRLLHVSFLSGYVELGPENRLEVHSPILREGTQVETPLVDTLKITGEGYHLDVDSTLAPSVVGFETAWYGVERNHGRIGYHFVPLSADRNIQGSVEHMPGPATNYFQFPPQAAFFRLFHKSEDNDILAFVIAGSTREDMDRRAKAVGNNLAECEKISGMCLALPRRVGVNPFLMVRVNGRDVTVPVGARLSAAIQAAGVKVPATVLPHLRVTKLFHGKPSPVEFDRQSSEILNLQLTGGEKLTWLNDTH